MAASECLFARTSRLSLAFCGWVTLSFVHIRRPSLPLRLLRLIPCAMFAIGLLGAALLPLERCGVTLWMEAGSEHGFILQALVVLLVLLHQPNSLHELEAGLEMLKSHVGGGRPPRRRLLLQCTLYWLLAAATCVLWLCFVLVPGRFHHPHYLVIMFLPDALRTPPGYWWAFIFHVVLVIFTCCVAATFDVCFFVWMNAVSFHLKELRAMVDTASDSLRGTGADRRACPENRVSATAAEDADNNGDDDDDDDGGGGGGGVVSSAGDRSSTKNWAPFVGDASLLDVATVIRVRTAPPCPPRAAGDRAAITDGGKVAALRAVTSQTARDAARSSVEVLDAVERYYADLCRFMDGLNSLCGLPLFAGYAASLTNIVTSSYAIVRLSTVFADDGAETKVASYVVYICLFLCRVIVYSVSGSNIMEKNWALTESLTKMKWLNMTKAARRRREAILQNTKLPFSVNAMGFFTVEKANILSITSFILTYFVILVQMGGHS